MYLWRSALGLLYWSCVYVLVAAPRAQWWRTCCEFSMSSSCRHSCFRSQSHSDLEQECRRVDEVALFACVDRREAAQRCCTPSTSDKCKSMCQKIFFHEPGSVRPSQQRLLQESCDPRVLTCMRPYIESFTQRNHRDSLPCCQKSDLVECQERCRDLLSDTTVYDDGQIVDELSLVCGPANPSAPLWQCFLQQSINKSNGCYVDGAKLQCCSRSTTTQCRDLCLKTFSKKWTDSVKDFDQRCSSNPNEAELNLCLQELDEQCVMGCSGLRYCTNFNDRPYELFRGCNVQADEAARKTVEFWRQGTITLASINGYSISVKDIRYCQPEKWKAIACILQIKPCEKSVRINNICRRDCIDTLSECLDRSRVPKGTSATSVCDALSTNSDSRSCVSLSSYLSPGTHRDQQNEVTTPCNPNPCNGSHVCEINRRPCHSHHHCPQFICKQGCPLGQVMSQLVAKHSYVRIPECSVSTDRVCHQVCKCGSQGVLHNCKYVGCVGKESCFLDSGMIQNHKARFMLGCNKCLCLSGETVCTMKACGPVSSPKDDQPNYHALPCNCNPVYSPVCGYNGQTFPNSCVARCNGLKNPMKLVLRACSTNDPCEPNPCGQMEKCVKRPQFCLSTNVSNCPQYECAFL